MSAITASPADRPAQFLWEAAQAAFGLNNATPREMMLGAGILSIAAYVSTALSFGATAVTIFVTGLLFGIGFIRFVWAAIRG